MRIRTIKPEFWASFTLSGLSEPALILAAGLLNHSCDKGYFECDPRLIKAAIFPLREPSRSIPGCLSELVGIGYVEIRKAPDGRLVGHVVKFLSHQRIEKPSKHPSKAMVDFANGTEASEFPKNHRATDELFPEDSRNTPGTLQEPSGKSGAGSGIREQGKGTGTEAADAAVEFEFPIELQTPRFKAAWSNWVAYRRERKLPAYKPVSFASQMKTLSEWGHDAAITAIEESIRQMWQGIHTPKFGTAKGPAQPEPKFTRV